MHLQEINSLKNEKCKKKLITIFFYENINHYINTMTGHSINTEQSQEFLSTMHTMIDDLDTISSNIDENTYLRLVNGLQCLYNIHNSSNQSPNSVREIINQRHIERFRENFQDNNEVQITRVLARHYERITDISGNPIRSDANPIISNANPIISNADIINNNNNANNNTINENIQSRIQSLNEESNRIGYSTRTRLALYGNVFNTFNNDAN